MAPSGRRLRADRPGLRPGRRSWRPASLAQRLVRRGRKGRRMSSPSSVAYWIGRLKAGDQDEAAQRLCRAFFSKVLAVARARLAAIPRLRTDAEDVAQSALDSFFRRAAAGKFPQ